MAFLPPVMGFGFHKGSNPSNKGEANVENAFGDLD